jgi:hypothetical protein
MEESTVKFSWVGSEVMYLDQPAVDAYGKLVAGRYGGNSAAGADKNEDGLFLLQDSRGGWEFVMLLDAHDSAESAELLVKTAEDEADIIIGCLSQPVSEAFEQLESFLTGLFTSDVFREECRKVRGETACLICARKDNYLWWFSVGDNSVYLLHPELAARGQYLLNQRNYYEWIGAVNAFDQPVACYSSGIRELREGRNIIVMTTDGLLECGNRLFENPLKLYEVFCNGLSTGDCMTTALDHVHQELGRDSATVVAWSFDNGRKAALPSDHRA